MRTYIHETIYMTIDILFLGDSLLIAPVILLVQISVVFTKRSCFT